MGDGKRKMGSGKSSCRAEFSVRPSGSQGVGVKRRGVFWDLGLRNHKTLKGQQLWVAKRHVTVG